MPTSSAKSTPPAPVVRHVQTDPVAGADLPVLVTNRFVDVRSGAVVGSLAGVDGYAAARPIDTPHLFRVGSLTVDASSQRIVAREPTAEVRTERGDLVREAPGGGGRELWRVSLGGRATSVRPPGLVTAAGRVMVALDGDLVGFDYATGQQVWQVAGPNDRLLAAGQLVLALDCNSHLPSVPQRWLVARRAADGREVFRTELPRKADPESLTERDGLFIVKNRQPHVTMFIDGAGKVTAQLDEHVSAHHAVADGWVIVTEKRIARIDRGGRTRWELAPFEDDFVPGSGFLSIGHAELVVYNHSAIADSGIELTRLTIAAGAERWRVRTKGLGVGHSEYYHSGYAVRRGKTWLAVVSQGSGGAFVETRDIATGELVARYTIGGS